MNKSLKSFFNIVLLFAMLCIMGITFLFSNFYFSCKDTFADQDDPVISDDNFTASFAAKSRKNTRISYEIQNVTTSTNEQIKYYVYKWSEIEYLTITISANIQVGTENEYRFCELNVANIKTDDLQTSTGLMQERNINRSILTSNRMSRQTLTYYIDSDTNLVESEFKKIGNDFGLYRFSFNYTANIDGSDRNINIGSLFIAIIPDNIDTKSTSNLKINYNVTSSNKLMNVFSLSIANGSSYKYVNPSYIQWKVVGKDIINVE